MKTILVVDDEPSNAEVMSLILEEEGYRVFTAVNGRHALERMRDVHPDLVLLDFMMPVLDGGQMGRALRADPATLRVPIVMNSSLEEEAVREHFDGYEAFLRKPFTVDALLAVVRRLLET